MSDTQHDNYPLTSNERRKSAWEQHFTTIGTSIMVAGIMFLGTQVWNTNTKLTEFSITNKYLADTITELKIQLNNMSNNYVTKSEFKDLETRVRKVENAK